MTAPLVLHNISYYLSIMKTLMVEFEETTASDWNNLPKECQSLIVSKALTSILKGEPYPIGADQLELAIDLAESGVDAELISRLSRLDKSVFEAFLQ
jgi:hypothetical protein